MAQFTVEDLVYQVSESELPRLWRQKWRVIRGRAVTGYGDKKIGIAQFLMGIPPGRNTRVTYKDGNKFNLRQTNLWIGKTARSKKDEENPFREANQLVSDRIKAEVLRQREENRLNREKARIARQVAKAKQVRREKLRSVLDEDRLLAIDTYLDQLPRRKNKKTG